MLVSKLIVNYIIKGWYSFWTIAQVFGDLKKGIPAIGCSRGL